MKTKGNKWWLTVLAFALALLLLLSCAPKATPTPAPVATPARPLAPVVATPTPAPVVATPAPTPAVTPTPTPVAKPIEMKLSTWAPITHWVIVEAWAPWLKKLEEETGGRLKGTIYPSEQLGKAVDHYDMVRRGITDVAQVVPGYTPGLFPLSTVAELPFAVQIASVGTEALWKVYEKGYLEAEFKDVKVLYLWVGTPYQLLTAKKRVLTLEDAKGLKIRTPGGVMTQVLESLGMSPIILAGAEAYPAMQRGVIDAVALSYATATPFKMQEITKYIAEVGYGVTVLGMLMNKGFWDKLPPDIKAVVERNSELGRRLTPRAYENNDGKAIDIFLKAGTQLYSLPPAERARWVAATKHLSDKWVSDMEGKGLPGKKVRDEFLSYLEGKQ